MMHKILNKLFGWDYIHWRNSADSGIARVRTDAVGIAYYYRYKSIDVIDRFNDGQTRIVWLTCRPEKYNVRVQSEYYGR